MITSKRGPSKGQNLSPRRGQKLGSQAQRRNTSIESGDEVLGGRRNLPRPHAKAFYPAKLASWPENKLKSVERGTVGRPQGNFCRGVVVLASGIRPPRQGRKM